MRIGGMQKLSLLDYPGMLCCTVFTIGCSFRCPFCHNASLLDSSAPQIAEQELLDYLQKRRGILDGVCVTGGEPLLHKDIGATLEKIKSLGFKVKLDTNGSQPDRLIQLVDEGLIDYVAMDIKNSPAKYAETAGVKAFDIAPVERSMRYLLSGSIPYEFRTTVVRELHTTEDMLALAGWIKGAQKYYLQPYVDSENVLVKGFSAYTEAEMHRIKDEVSAIVPTVEIRGI